MNSLSATQQLADAGVSLWLDDLSRSALADVSLAELIRHANVTGVTTNPTIFQAAFTAGDSYDPALADLARAGATADEAVFALTTEDVAAACALLHDTWVATDEVDGRVSIQVDPRLARDTAATISEALRLHAAVDSRNLLVTIPATAEGLAAIRATIADGISVNATLIFSSDRYAAVIRAYQAGIVRARDSGRDISRIHSVASFYVSRVDAEIDARLDAINDPLATALKGKAAIANACLAHELHQRMFDTPAWAALESEGAHRQRLLWASTGIKDPGHLDTVYVTDLVAANVVNTVTRPTLEAVQEHGIVRGDTITANYRRAHKIMDSLAGLGIPFDVVAEKLESEGLARFESSWAELLAHVHARLAFASVDH